MFKKTALLTAAVAGLALAGAASAAIITPSSATANQNGGPDNNFVELIDGSGLSGVGDILDQTHATATGGNWAYFGGGPDFTGDTVTFVVPTDSTVGAVHVWPFWLSPNFNWQATSFDIEVSTDGGSNFTNIGGVTLDDIQATGPAGAIEVQTRTFATQTGVDQIRFSNIGNNGGVLAGIMEVRFDSVPEPASLALLGLGGLVMLRRR